MPKTPDMDVAHPQLQFLKKMKVGNQEMANEAYGRSLTAFKRRTAGRGISTNQRPCFSFFLKSTRTISGLFFHLVLGAVFLVCCGCGATYGAGVCIAVSRNPLAKFSMVLGSGDSAPMTFMGLTEKFCSAPFIKEEHTAP